MNVAFAPEIITLAVNEAVLPATSNLGPLIVVLAAVNDTLANKLLACN